MSQYGVCVPFCLMMYLDCSCKIRALWRTKRLCLFCFPTSGRACEKWLCLQWKTYLCLILWW